MPKFKLKFFLGDKQGMEVIKRIKLPKEFFNPDFTDFKNLPNDWSKVTEENFIDTFESSKGTVCYKINKVSYDPGMDITKVKIINYIMKIKGVGDPWIDAGTPTPENTMAAVWLEEEKC